MISEADEGHGVLNTLRQISQGRLDVLARDPTARISLGNSEGRNLRPTLIAPPAEDARGQLHFPLLRAHENIAILAVLAHDPRESGGMAERINVISNAREYPEFLHEVFPAQFNLFPESKAARAVAIRLNPPAAHDVPAACLYMGSDSLEQFRVNP